MFSPTLRRIPIHLEHGRQGPGPICKVAAVTNPRASTSEHRTSSNFLQRKQVQTCRVPRYLILTNNALNPRLLHRLLHGKSELLTRHGSIAEDVKHAALNRFLQDPTRSQSAAPFPSPRLNLPKELMHTYLVNECTSHSNAPNPARCSPPRNTTPMLPYF
jgi:hypothetical protein